MTCKSLLPALYTCIIFMGFSADKAIAQQNSVMVPFYTKAMDRAKETYHEAFGDEIALHNGWRYIEYPFRFYKGDPYFNAPEPFKGSIFYDGIRYDSVVMRYNEITDELIINDYIEKIQLQKSKIEWFTAPGNYFIKLQKDSNNNQLISNGFYNLLYDGQITLLKKEIKTIQENLSASSEMPDYVDQHDYYYIKKNGAFYPVKNKKDIFNLFADKKQEVQQFIKSHSLNFKRDRQNMLTQTTAYYDSLKK